MFTSPPPSPLETVERAIQRTIVNPHGRSPGRSKIHLKTLDIARLLLESPLSFLLLLLLLLPSILRNLDYFVHQRLRSFRHEYMRFRRVYF